MFAVLPVYGSPGASRPGAKAAIMTTSRKAAATITLVRCKRVPRRRGARRTTAGFGCVTSGVLRGGSGCNGVDGTGVLGDFSTVCAMIKSFLSSCNSARGSGVGISNGYPRIGQRQDEIHQQVGCNKHDGAQHHHALDDR